MTATAPSTRSPDLVRLLVAWSGRRSELVLPAHLPVGELVSTVAAHVGALDQGEVHRGCVLVTDDGRVLDLETGLADQSVADGATVTLVLGLGPGGDPNEGVEGIEGVLHDDLVDAVSEALSVVSPEWGPGDSRAGLRMLGGLALAGGALVLGLHHAAGPTVVVGSLGLAVLLLLVGAVVAHRATPESAEPPETSGPSGASEFSALPSSADLLLLAAGPYAAVAGLALGASVGGHPTVSAGVALSLAAGAAFVLGARDRPRARRAALVLPWLTLGLFAVVVGATVSVVSLPLQQVMTVDLVALVVVGLAARRVVPLPPVGHPLAVAGVLAVDLVLLVSAPAVGARSGWAGLALIGVAGFLQAVETRAVLGARHRGGGPHGGWLEVVGVVLLVVLLVALLVIAVRLVPLPLGAT